MNIFKNKKEKNERKGIKIWPLVGSIYCPIIFAVVVINLPKVEWKYVFESNKTRAARHHKKAEDTGFPGIPYWRNSGSAAILYLNRDGVAYAMCGPDFFCSEELNAKQGIHFMPISGGARRINSKVISAADSYWCDSYDINHSGKCGSGGWVNGSER